MECNTYTHADVTLWCFKTQKLFHTKYGISLSTLALNTCIIYRTMWLMTLHTYLRSYINHTPTVYIMHTHTLYIPVQDDIAQVGQCLGVFVASLLEVCLTSRRHSDQGKTQDPVCETGSSVGKPGVKVEEGGRTEFTDACLVWSNDYINSYAVFGEKQWEMAWV